jgi:NADPH:quinone reductase-like Zn-dependent oxidoreductase
MKAIILREHGAPDVLRYEDTPTPEPQAGEVLVKVHAVSVNRTLDLAVRAGTYARKVQLPHVIGTDPSGEIVAVGPGVTERKVGDRVAVTSWPHPTDPAQGLQIPGIHAWGGYAEYIKVPAVGTKPVPPGLDFATATVIARHAPTAYFQLQTQGEVREGDWVLIMGASGGLGSLAVQVAKLLGARVIGAAGADERVAQAIELGADAGVNYRTSDLTEEVRRITDAKGVNIVLENIGDPVLFPKALKSLARNGRLVTAGGHGGGQVTVDINFLYLNQNRIIGGTGARPGAFEAAMDAAAAGRLKANIDRIMPLSQAAEAHALVAARNITGKVILDPTQA